MVVQRRHGHGKGKFGRLPHVGGNLECLGSIPETQALGEFEYAVLAADAHIFFYIRHGNFLHPFRQVFQELFRFYGNFSKVRAGALCQKQSRLRMDAQPAAFIVRLNPLREFIVPEGQRLHNDARFEDALVQRLTFIGRCAVHQNHQHGALQRVLAVEGELLQALHLLGFLHHHQLPVRHHGETAGGRDDGVCIDIGPVANGFVEVFFPVLEAIVDDGACHQLRVIGFLAHE